MRRTLHLLFLLIALPGAAEAQQVALKTNMLFWLTGTPNVGMEIGLSPRLTFDLGGMYNAWKYPKQMKLNNYGAQAEIRYWFCRKFEGHFLGIHGQFAHFNIGQIPFIPSLEEHVLRGDLLGGGLTYGYHWAVGERWGIEAMLGAGYLQVEYEKFRCADCGERVGRYTHTYYGPTRAGVSVIYFLR